MYCGSPKVIMTLYDSYLFHSSDVKVLLVMYAGFDTNKGNKRGQWKPECEQGRTEVFRDSDWGLFWILVCGVFAVWESSQASQ